jgi:hypothetical protein
LRKQTLLLIASLLFTSFFLVSLQKDYSVLAAPEYEITKLDRVIAPLYGGILLINDTIEISSFNESTTVDQVAIGFPVRYEQYLSDIAAYDDNEARLSLVEDTGLGAVGYYGATVDFPNGISLQSGESFSFKITTLFSDMLTSSARTVNVTREYVFTAEFPLYPSFSQEVSDCTVRVEIPENTTYEQVDEIDFNLTESNGQQILTYSKESLESYADNTVKVRFFSDNSDAFTLFSVRSLSREVMIDASHEISVTERYQIASHNLFTMNTMKLIVPEDAENISSFDEQGKELGLEISADNIGAIMISFQVDANQVGGFSLEYGLSGERRHLSLSEGDYRLNLSLFEGLEVIPESFTVEVVFPEGATVQSFPSQRYALNRDVFRETLFSSFSNVSWLHDEEWTFTYSYTLFWASFRPTVWVTMMVVVGSIVALAWQRPQAPKPMVTVTVPRKTMNAFVESYETKKKTLTELDEVKNKAKKGKISRRRYKVRKTTLENRLSNLSRELAGMREIISRSGSRYAEIMRQLEVAEIELENIDANINRIELRFKKGEISAQTYRRLLDDDLRRRERSKATIDGVLLRLRE